jgi:hypothetical protein
MAEVLSIELKRLTPTGIARFTVGISPIGADGTPVLNDSTNPEIDGTPVLPTVKTIKFFKHEIDTGRIWVGPCFLVTLEEDLKMVVDKNDVSLTLYRNEKKSDIS